MPPYLPFPGLRALPRFPPPLAYVSESKVASKDMETENVLKERTEEIGHDSTLLL